MGRKFPDFLNPNYLGQTFGRLTVVEKLSKSLWRCTCLCGGTKDVKAYYFKQIKYITCGNCKTQQTYPREYKTYDSMKQRCLNSNAPDYPSYGGRGITICDRWLRDFYYFLEDMGTRPEGYTLDRKEVNGNYEKDNCKWSTAYEQNINKRTSKVFDVYDIVHTPNGYFK